VEFITFDADEGVEANMEVLVQEFK